MKKTWGRIDSGGSRGLQIRCRVVLPAEVGSIPTRSCHFILKGGGFHDRSDKNTIDPDVIKGWLSQQDESQGPGTSFVSARQDSQ